jgi:hypothetical protein
MDRPQGWAGRQPGTNRLLPGRGVVAVARSRHPPPAPPRRAGALHRRRAELGRRDRACPGARGRAGHREPDQGVSPASGMLRQVVPPFRDSSMESVAHQARSTGSAGSLASGLKLSDCSKTGLWPASTAQAVPGFTVRSMAASSTLAGNRWTRDSGLGVPAALAGTNWSWPDHLASTHRAVASRRSRWPDRARPSTSTRTPRRRAARGRRAGPGDLQPGGRLGDGRVEAHGPWRRPQADDGHRVAPAAQRHHTVGTHPAGGRHLEGGGELATGAPIQRSIEQQAGAARGTPAEAHPALGRAWRLPAAAWSTPRAVTSEPGGPAAGLRVMVTPAGTVKVEPPSAGGSEISGR